MDMYYWPAARKHTFAD